VQRHQVGAVLTALDGAALERSVGAVETILADRGIRARCRATAAALFDVDAGAARYRSLYHALVNRRPAT
jgi:hypothetical protein